METPTGLIAKAEALEEEAKRMEDFGHPRQWPNRLRNRAEHFRARAAELPAPQPRTVDRDALLVALGQADGAHMTQSPVVRAYAYEALYGRFADAVLALLSEVREEGEGHMSGT